MVYFVVVAVHPIDSYIEILPFCSHLASQKDRVQLLLPFSVHLLGVNYFCTSEYVYRYGWVLIAERMNIDKLAAEPV